MNARGTIPDPDPTADTYTTLEEQTVVAARVSYWPVIAGGLVLAFVAYKVLR